ncbi:protein ORF18 [Cyprinid herpesvirus 3]|nr:protein ORF18 [Cyprinid herpesvirus 3]
MMNAANGLPAGDIAAASGSSWSAYAAELTPVLTRRNTNLPNVEWCLEPAAEYQMLRDGLEWLERSAKNIPFVHVRLNPLNRYTRVSEIFGRMPGYGWRPIVETTPVDSKPQHFKEIFTRFEECERTLSKDLFEFAAWWLARKLLMSWELKVANKGPALQEEELTWDDLLKPYAVPSILELLQVSVGDDAEADSDSEDEDEDERRGEDEGEEGERIEGEESDATDIDDLLPPSCKRRKRTHGTDDVVVSDNNKDNKAPFGDLFFPDGYRGNQLGLVKSALVIVLSACPDCFAQELKLQCDRYAWLTTGYGVPQLTDFYLTPVLLRHNLYPAYETAFLAFDYVLKSCRAPPFTGFMDDKCWDMLGVHLWWIFNFVKDTRLLAREAVHNSLDLLRNTRDSESYHFELWSAMHSTHVYPTSKLQLQVNAVLVPKMPRKVASAVWKRDGMLISPSVYAQENETLWNFAGNLSVVTRKQFLDLVDPKNRREDFSWRNARSKASRSQMLWDAIRIGLKVWTGGEPIKPKEQRRLERSKYYFGKKFQAALDAGLDPDTACPCVGWEDVEDMRLFMNVMVAIDNYDRKPVWSFLSETERGVRRRLQVSYKPSEIADHAKYFATTTNAVNACMTFLTKMARGVRVQRSDHFGWEDLRRAEDPENNPLLKQLQSTLDSICHMSVSRFTVPMSATNDDDVIEIQDPDTDYEAIVDSPQAAPSLSATVTTTPSSPSQPTVQIRTRATGVIFVDDDDL